MNTGEWFLGGTTIFLGLIAVAAIVINVWINRKNIRENRRIRNEDRTLNFRLKLLDEVRDWAREAVKAGFVFKRAQDEGDKVGIRQVNERIEDIAKTSDVTKMTAEIFKSELAAPVKMAVGQVINYKKPGVLGSDKYFESLRNLLKTINSVKRGLYHENAPPE